MGLAEATVPESVPSATPLRKNDLRLVVNVIAKMFQPDPTLEEDVPIDATLFKSNSCVVVPPVLHSRVPVVPSLFSIALPPPPVTFTTAIAVKPLSGTGISAVSCISSVDPLNTQVVRLFSVPVVKDPPALRIPFTELSDLSVNVPPDSESEASSQRVQPVTP